MRIREPIILLLILSISNFIIFEAEGDSEPNNTFSEAESLKDGSHNGNVSLYGGMDVDVFRIHLHRKEMVNISVALLEKGHLQVKGYYNSENIIKNLSVSLMETGDHGSMKFTNGDSPKDIYLVISGNSVYRLNIHTSMDPIRGFLSDNLNITLIFIGIALLISIIIIIMIFFFIRTINLSISNGFDAKECEEGKKVSLVDKRFRHDCMAIMTDDNGVERMMHPFEAHRFKDKQNINHFRIRRMDVDYKGYEE